MLRMWLTNLLLFLLLMALTIGRGHAQGAYIADRDQKLFTAQAQTYTINNRIGALNLTLEYVVSGSPGSLTITITGCMRGGTCDTLDTYTGTTSSNRKITGLYDNYVVTITTLSGGTSPTIQMNAFFSAGAFLNSSSGGGPIASGGSAIADGQPSNPIVQAFSNGAGATLGYPFLFNGSATVGWDKERSASLANLPTSQTLTARNSIGATLFEKGSRWANPPSTPAAGSQATTSIAAEASVRHVADCVSFSAGSVVAPALTALTVNLRDGATGAGTILHQWQVIIPAATGQNVAPFSVCGLNLVGTTNTAMTLEFSAALASLIESVSLTGYNVN